jgi:hypothetical protein
VLSSQRVDLAKNADVNTLGMKPVGAAEGCDLLIFFTARSKDRSVPQLLQGNALQL